MSSDPRNELPEFASLDQQTSDPTKDDLIGALQNQLVDEQDKRKEERFVWLCVVILIVDVFTFPHMAIWTAPLLIGIIELLLLIALGRKWGMDDIWTITEKIIDRFPSNQK